MLLCTDDALPSPDPEPAPPSLGDVIDAMKAAFEQAVQISTTGTVHKALEQVVGELSPQKTPEEQSPAVETAVDYTTEEAAKEEAVVLTAGEPDAHMLESNEQTFEEPAQEGLTQDIELAEEIQGLIPQESSISEPDEKSVIKPGEILEAVDSVQEPLESVLQDPEIVEVGEPMTEESHADESPVQMNLDTQNKKQSERGAAEMQVVEDEDVEEPEQGLVEKEAQLSEMEEKTSKGGIEKVEVTISRGQVKLQGQQEEESMEREDTEWDKESEHSQEEWQAVTAQMGPDGGVVDMDEVEQEQEEQEVAKTEEGVIEVEARREEVEAGSEAQLQKVSREEAVHPTDKTVLKKTQQEPGNELIINVHLPPKTTLNQYK